MKKRSNIPVPDTDMDTPWEGRAILLVDLDAFFAAVEQLDHPEWRGKPLIVGGSAEKRGVVSTASYEARVFGVHSAMAAVRAEQLCPHAIWARGNFTRYREVSKQVMEILQNETPLVEQISIDEAFADVSPGRFTHEDPRAIADRIRRNVEALGVTCSIGISTNKTVSKIASDMNKPNGLTVVFPGEERSFLNDLPISVMSGIGRKTEDKLKSFGIHTLGELAASDRNVVKSLFGKNTDMMLDRAAGKDERSIDLEDETKSISNEQTFATDLSDAEEIKAAIAMLAAKVGRRLRKKGFAGYTVTLKVKYSDHSIHTAQKTLPSQVDNEREFTPVLFKLLSEVWHAGCDLRLIGVGVSSFKEKVEQLNLFGDTLDEPENNTHKAKATHKDEGGAVCDTRNTSSKAGGSSHHKNDKSLVKATDEVKERFGDDAVHYGRDLRFKGRDTETAPMNKAED